jgi:hypothetical protein
MLLWPPPPLLLPLDEVNLQCRGNPECPKTKMLHFFRLQQASPRLGPGPGVHRLEMCGHDERSSHPSLRTTRLAVSPALF